MAVDYSRNAFAESFMQGFSFVDRAFSNRRAERRLEQRLQEEREARAYQRELSEERRARETATWERQQQDQRMQDEAAAIYERGDWTDDELRKYGRYDPRLQAEYDKKVRKGEIREAVTTANTIGRGGLTGGATAVVGQTTGQGGQPETSAPEAAANDASEQAKSLFQPNRGETNMQEVDADEYLPYDPEYQKKGLVGRVGDWAAGVGANVSEVAEDVVKAPFRAAEGITADVRGIERVTTRGNIGTNVGGNIMVPADRWTDEEEMAALSVDQKQAAIEQNIAVIEEYKAKARRPNGNELMPVTRHGAVQQGSEEALNQARRYEARAISQFEDVVNNPTNSVLVQTAAQDPAAAAAMYFESRNTVYARNQDLAMAVDAQMVPVLDNYTRQLASEASALPAGSPEQKRVLARQANVVRSRNQIAETQQSVNQIVGVKGGLPVGNAQLAGQVTGAAFDPNRPSYVPGTMPGSKANAAMTVAGRITPSTRRLSDKQVDALVTLVDYGLVDKATFTTVLATGGWPPGKDPNAIKQMMKGGDGYALALTEGGAVQVIPLPGYKAPGSAVPNQEITLDNMGNILAGAGLQVGGQDNLSPEAQNAITALVMNNSGYIRSTFAITSEEQQIKLGQVIQQSWMLSEWNKNENYGGLFEPNEKNAPTAQDVFMNPALRQQIAADYAEEEGKRIQLVSVPPRITEAEDIDWEAARQSVRNGDLVDYGITPQMADSLKNEDLAYIIYMLNSSPEQIERDQNGLR